MKSFGEETGAAIAASHRNEPPLDLTVRGDPQGWADKLGGLLLPTGSVRLRERHAITNLPGFAEGAWWVQDAAAALPVRLLAPMPGERIADLCAAPGGKTAQLAAAGASVTAVDRSGPRLRRLRANLERLGLTADIVAKDAVNWQAEPFDAVLLDAPCSATGTIRRHPDVAWSKTPEDRDKLAALQARLLSSAARLTRPGGRLVYCTCSLEPQEGEEQVEAFLARHGEFRREPVRPDEIGGLTEAVTPQGDLRTLPHQLVGGEPRLSGWAGFYASRLIRL
jgi:16S rRNA (cytosine967-C5)-methyltransferase